MRHGCKSKSNVLGYTKLSFRRLCWLPGEVLCSTLRAVFSSMPLGASFFVCFVSAWDPRRNLVWSLEIDPFVIICMVLAMSILMILGHLSGRGQRQGPVVIRAEY